MSHNNSTNPTLFQDQEITPKDGKRYLHRKVSFKAYNTGQRELFPEDIEQTIVPTHIARFINVAVNAVNIDEIISKYKGGGTSAYDPRLLLKAWLLGFVYKSYSSRGLARLMKENLAFKWISGGEEIDFRTSNNFRLRLGAEMKSIFRQVLQVALKKKIIQAKDIFLDHSKFEANANRFRIVWKKRVEKQISKIDEELNQLFSYVKRIEIVENKKYGGNDYSETVKKDYSDEEVASMINDTNVDLKSKKIDRDEARERKAKFRRLKLLLQRLKTYRHKKRILGKKRRSYSITDPDATAMMQKDDTIKAAYNEGVATENGLVLDYHISNTSGDADKLIDLAEGVEENTGKTPESITADSAYGTENNYEYMQSKNIKANVKYSLYHPEKTKAWQQRNLRPSEFLYEAETDRYRCPQGSYLGFNRVIHRKKNEHAAEIKVYSAELQDCSQCQLKQYCTKGKKRSLYINKNYEHLKQKAREQLHSKEGRALSKQRGHGVETVFGHKKANAKYKRYLLRGMAKVEIEAGLFYTTYNLEKIYRYVMKTLAQGTREFDLFEDKRIPPLIASL